MSTVSDVKDGLLAILKASGAKTAALSVAAWLLIYASRKNMLGIRLRPSVIEVLFIASVVFGSLAISSFVVAIGPFVTKETWGRLVRWKRDQDAKHYVVEQLPHLDFREKQIIAYLLENNEKMFTTTVDGGYAGTLISKGIVVCALVPGQRCDQYRVPFKVPDPIWEVLTEHKTEFPYAPTRELPWSIPWMAR